MKTAMAMLSAGALITSCAVSGPNDRDDDGEGTTGAGASGSSGTDSGAGAGATTSSSGSGAGTPGEACAHPSLDPNAARPADMFSVSELTDLAARLPCIEDPALVEILESADTMFYDKNSIIPGYQDSFGDGFNFPVGMRPNTIQSNLIDLAVPGGHGQLFVERGTFHFPFGSPTGVDDVDGTVVDFWKPPREGGELLPVVWWWHEPNGNTHRIEWMFPVGTVFGELLFIVDDAGAQHPFEIRTRTRTLTGWTADVFRPFPTAIDFANALATKRQEQTEWASSTEIDTLIAHLNDTSTLTSASLTATHFTESFQTIQGAMDVLPALTDTTILEELLATWGFRSARDAVWKESGGMRAYAAGSNAKMSIVPRNYNAGLVAVNDSSCESCHVDAGRPFMDYYFNIMAYGELWGEDQVFTWHPFDNGSFVDGSGNVVSFNDDNRSFRQDFVNAGLLESYSSSQHGDSHYQEIPAPWRGYVYP